MDKTEFLKSIFSLAELGMYVPLDNLPSDISKEVVEKNLLLIELKNLKKSNGNPGRITEIENYLNPTQKEEEIDE